MAGFVIYSPISTPISKFLTSSFFIIPLILTNDGEFVYKVTHPKHEIEKTYTVTIKGIIKKEEVTYPIGLFNKI